MNIHGNFTIGIEHVICNYLVIVFLYTIYTFQRLGNSHNRRIFDDENYCSAMTNYNNIVLFTIRCFVRRTSTAKNASFQGFDGLHQRSAQRTWTK